MVREVIGRLRQLTPEQLQLLLHGTRTDQDLLLWLACCKRFQLIADFAREILRTRFLRLELVIESNDADNFIESQSVWHEEIEELKPSTRQKLASVLIQMLREAELISADGLIQPKLLSPGLVKVIADDSVEHFQCFPVSEADVKAALS